MSPPGSSVLLRVATLLAAMAPAAITRAALPHALAIADDVANRVLLFAPYDGEYVGELVPPDAEHLTAPWDCEIGPALQQAGKQYPDTILVSDLRKRAVVAYDAVSGKFIKTLIADVDAHGLAYGRDGKLLVAAGKAGVRAYEPSGTFVATRVAPELVDGPNNAWDVLVRPLVDGGAGDMLVGDPTLDVIVRLDLSGKRLGLFAKLPAFRFVEHLALRRDGRVLAVDVFGNAVHEFQPDGTWLRSISVTRPRGVFELFNGHLLVASEQGVQVFDGQNGTLRETKLAGYPTSAPRCIRYLRGLTPGVVGDLNCDFTVNNFDIDPFVLALTNPSKYEQRFPLCDRMLADTSGDGVVNNFDIDPFVRLLAP